MKYFELGYITKRELEEELKRAGGLSPWNPTLEPTKIQAGVYTSPGSFVLQADFNGILDDVSSSSKGTIIYFFKDTQRWGIISGEDKNKGVFQTVAQLQVAYPTATNGDYALIIEFGTFFAYYNNQWNNTGSNVAPDALRSTNNLNDLSSKPTARINLDVFSKKETKDNVGALLVDTATIDFSYSNTVGNENITAIIKDNSILNSKIASNADIATSKIKQAVITPQIGAFTNNDTQDIINNKAQGQITNLENLLNTRPVGASNGSVYYLTSQASAIPNYELLSFSPDNSPLDVESITITSTTPKVDRLFHSYVSTYEVGNAIINGGNWIFNFYGYTSHINNNVFEIDVYKMDISNVETLLFTCETSNLLQTSQTSPELNVANVEITKQDFACNTTDKIVVKIYAKTDRAVATTITLLHSGTDYASHIHTTLIASHNQLAGTQGGTANEKYHLNLSDYNKVLALDASFALKEDVANKATAFSATPANIKYPTEKLVKDSLDTKVDKVAGKGLSTNDYTTAEQTKLAGIAAGATANSTDATLLNRANHTGTQDISTINSLSGALNDKFGKTTTNEINTLLDKSTLGDTDVLMIEDIADSGKKKKVSALNNYNYINSKLASQFNAKVGITTNDVIAGNKTFSNNITLSSIPSDLTHVARLKDAVDLVSALGSQVGQPSGIASLGADGKVPSSQLPSSYDDIFWYNTFSNFPATGATEVMYVAKDTGSIYQWTGAIYAKVGLLNKSDIGLSNVDNTSDISKPISNATQTALNLKENTITAGTTSQYYRGDKTFQTLDKTAVGLANVDNTSDLNKPISNATQTALADKFSKTTNSEINILTNKSPIVNADVVMIEDSASSFSKKKTSISDISTRVFSNSSNRKMVFLSLSGSDTNNGYSQETAVATLTQALTIAGNAGNQIEVLPAVYTGDYSITQLNISISGSNLEARGICSFSGTLTSSNASSSQALQGLTIGKVIHSGAGSLYLRSCTIGGVAGSSLVASGNGYLDVDNVDFSTGTIAITGSGNKNLNNTKGGILTVNNASAIVNVRNALTIISPTLIAGTLSISNCPIYSVASGANAITTSAGSILYLSNVSIVNPDGTNARINIPAGAFYSFNNVIYDRANSTIAGTSLNREANFDKIIAPNKQDVINDGNKINTIATDIASASTVNLDNATGDIVNITGTTNITAITLSAGIKRFVRFSNSLTLTNSANLVLPSGANIATAVGDTAIFIGYAGGVVRCVSYTKADGTALVGGAGGGDVSSVETSTADSQLVLFSGTGGKTIKKFNNASGALRAIKIDASNVITADKIYGTDIEITTSNANELLSVNAGKSVVSSSYKVVNSATPTNQHLWDALYTKIYIDSSIGGDTVYSTSLNYGTNVNLDVSANKFSIITVVDGDAIAILPATLNNAGKIMKIKCASSSIGRLYINNSEKGNNKYFILADDVAIFECDNTAWRLVSGPNYVIPFFGSGQQSSGKGIIFALKEKLMALGVGDQNLSGSPFSNANFSHVPSQLPILDTNGTIYRGTITGWQEILTGYLNAIALTNEGEVFVWGAYWADGVGNNKSRFPRKVSFPAGVVISKVYMANSIGNQTFMAYYALTTDGKLYAWGNNNWGNLGINSIVNQNTPTLITTLQNVVITKFSTGGNFGIFCQAIDSNKQLWGWGYNSTVSFGSPVGISGTADVLVPTQISGINDAEDVVSAVGAISADSKNKGYSRILRSDKSTWATGFNLYGTLALNNTTQDIRTYTREAQNKTNVERIFGAANSGAGVSIIIDSGFIVYFAGYNGRGIFGAGNTTNITQFVLNATQSSAEFQSKMYSNRGVKANVKVQGSYDYDQTLIGILDGDGNLYMCGYNVSGMCSDGTTTDRNTFNKVKLPSNKRVIDFMLVGAMEASNRGVIALFEDGTMCAWGRNTNGSLGNQIPPSDNILEYPAWLVGFSPEAIKK